MKKEVLILLLPHYADWEVSFAAATLNNQIQNIESKYSIKTVGITADPIPSIGGLTILPDYSIENIPTNYVALLLIGGMSWCTTDRQPTTLTEKLIPFVQNTIDRNIIVGAICDATTFLGANGWLNNCAHTSNTLSDLKKVAGSRYSNEKNYQNQQAVSDKNIITANGTAYLEFSKEILSALNAYSKNDIETHYDFYKHGYYEAMKKHGVAKGI